MRLPLEGGVLLKARAPWPATARVYCHRFESSWPGDAEVVEQTPVRLCRRRGAAIDLVLEQPRQSRSQFVFTQGAGGRRSSGKPRRPLAPPIRAGRIPRRRTLPGPVTITVDTRERYPYRFAQRQAETIRAAVPAGDYAVHGPDGGILAAVERTSLDDLASALSNGTLAFQLQGLAELPLAVVVIEARYSALCKRDYVDGGWLADQLARLQARCPEVPLVFADARRYAEDWTYRFLTTALADTAPPDAANDEPR